jgi:hypothetical protein
MFYKALLIVTALAVAVSGQADPTSLSPCLIQCVLSAAKQNGCGGPELADLNVTCLCTNVQFQADVTLCLTQHCTTADQAVAVDLKSQCLAASITPSATTTPAASAVPFTTEPTATARR